MLPHRSTAAPRTPRPFRAPRRHQARRQRSEAGSTSRRKPRSLTCVLRVPALLTQRARSERPEDLQRSHIAPWARARRGGEDLSSAAAECYPLPVFLVTQAGGTQMNMWKGITFVAASTVVSVSTCASLAYANCDYGGSYSSGAHTCQNGYDYVCETGANGGPDFWRGTGETCDD
jgi:hypothetical protein